MNIVGGWGGERGRRTQSCLKGVGGNEAVCWRGGGAKMKLFGERERSCFGAKVKRSLPAGASRHISGPGASNTTKMVMGEEKKRERILGGPAEGGPASGLAKPTTTTTTTTTPPPFSHLLLFPPLHPFPLPFSSSPSFLLLPSFPLLPLSSHPLHLRPLPLRSPLVLWLLCEVPAAKTWYGVPTLTVGGRRWVATAPMVGCWCVPCAETAHSQRCVVLSQQPALSSWLSCPIEANFGQSNLGQSFWPVGVGVGWCCSVLCVFHLFVVLLCLCLVLVGVTYLGQIPLPNFFSS